MARGSKRVGSGCTAVNCDDAKRHNSNGVKTKGKEREDEREIEKKRVPGFTPSSIPPSF